MADYTQLKSSVQAVVKQNGNEEITGELLQNALLSIISTLGDGGIYKGLAVPGTTPGTPDANVFYLANTPGVYSNFGGLTISDNELFLIKNNSANAWVAEKIISLENLSIAGSVLDNANVKLNESELKAIKAIKDLKLYGFDKQKKYVIQVLVAPGGSISPRMWISDFNNPTERYIISLNASSTISKTVWIREGKTVEILIDWTGLTGTVLNGLVNSKLTISKNCFKDSKPATIDDVNLLRNDLNNLIANFNALKQDIETTFDELFETSTVRKWVDSINGLDSSSYGGVITAWGFPIGVKNNIYGFRLVRKGSANNVRIVIRANNRDGVVLYNKKHAINADLTVTLDNVVVNENKYNLWVETYFDATVMCNRVTPAQIYTEAKGFPFPRWSTDLSMIDNENPILSGGAAIGYYDIKIDIDCIVSEKSINPELLPNSTGGGTAIETTKLKKNLRVSCVGSSVTWGTGFLQDSMLAYLIPQMQKNNSKCIIANEATILGTSTILSTVNDRLFFDKKAVEITGIGNGVQFELDGDEITIVQGIKRNNSVASIIELYIDDVLHDTFSNFNTEPNGHETKTFIAVAGQKEFPIGRPYTYNHILKVNGVTQTVTLNKGMAMPPSGWAVARDIMDISGNIIVQHTAFAPTGLNAGDVVTIEYDYGHELRYEKTTIGKDGAGVLESAYGRGYTPFDPANPGSSAFGSGLDFRETNEKVILKYVFESSKKRKVFLKIKSLDPRATGTGEPYLIFNFATNRIFYFQNAGIGGWKSTQFNDPTGSMGNVLRTWREVVEFQPDIIFYESTPNDDWAVGGYKLYNQTTGLTLAQLQDIRTMPNKLIQYNSGENTYNYERWAGIIQSINKNGLTLTPETLISIDPTPGDSIVIGSYYSDPKQCVERLVKSYDAATKTITFDNPINARDFVYNDLSHFVGKEVQVRDLTAYTTPTIELLDKFKTAESNPKIGLVPNPAPNLKSRDLAAYKPLLKKLVKDGEANFYIDLNNVYDWQFSQRRNATVTVPATSLITNSDGTKSFDLTSITKGNNFMDYQIIVGGVDVTNNDAVVYTSYCLGVDRTLTGAALNDTATRGKQVWGNFFPKLIFLRNAPTTGNIVVNYTTNLWSNDSCHMNTNSQQLFSIGYLKFINDTI